MNYKNILIFEKKDYLEKFVFYCEQEFFEKNQVFHYKDFINLYLSQIEEKSGIKFIFNSYKTIDFELFFYKFLEIISKTKYINIISQIYSQKKEICNIINTIYNNFCKKYIKNNYKNFLNDIENIFLNNIEKIFHDFEIYYPESRYDDFFLKIYKKFFIETHYELLYKKNIYDKFYYLNFYEFCNSILNTKEFNYAEILKFLNIKFNQLIEY
jgi:hypothetical protein